VVGGVDGGVAAEEFKEKWLMLLGTQHITRIVLL
jgi:hypothetical protein